MSAVAGVGMLGAERLLYGRQCAPVERLGLLVGGGRNVQRGEIVKRDGGVGMLGAERLLYDRQRVLVERRGLRVGADGLVEHGEIVERDGSVGMLGAARLLSDRQRALRKWNGFLVPSRCIVLHDLPGQAQRFRDVAFLRACRGQLREREQKGRGDAPFVQPQPTPVLHRALLSGIRRREGIARRSPNRPG